AQNPRALPYFTPPALPMSIAGELLAQWTNQGVDIWSCSPVGSLVEEEVIRWLCDLAGYGRASFGVLTSGGVMAHPMAVTVDPRPRRPPAAQRRPQPQAAGRRPRGRSRVCLRPDALLDQAGARRARVPAVDDARRRIGRTLPAAGRRTRRGGGGRPCRGSPAV